MDAEERDAIRAEIMEATDASVLIERVSAHAWGHRGTEAFPIAVQAAADAHNSGKFDLLAAFQAAASDDLRERGSLLRATLFLVQLIPALQATALQVADCVSAFTARSAEEQGVFEVHRGFIGWCRADPQRPESALQVISSNMEKYGRLLLFSLEAGCVVDPASFVPKTLVFAKSADREVRLRALAAMGGMDLRSIPHLQKLVVERLLDEASTGTDDRIVATCVSSLTAVAARDQDQAPLLSLLNGLTGVAGPETQFALAQATWRLSSLADDDLLTALLSTLEGVDCTHRNTVTQIDLGLGELLSEQRLDLVASFIAKFVSRCDGSEALKMFDSFTHKLTAEHRDLLGLLLIKWFHKGSDPCRAQLANLLVEVNDEAIEFDVDFDQFALSDAELLFVCRKVLGYMPLAPVASASLLVSALRSAGNKAADQICDLIYNPLLINYTGKALDYVKRRAAAEAAPTNRKLARVVKRIEKYLRDLQSIATVPELHPSPQQRLIQAQRQADESAATMKAAREQSVFFSIVRSTMVLKGSATVDYIEGEDGALHRSHMQMGTYSTAMALPRLDVFDPLGLSYLLFMFRKERAP